MVLLGAWWFFFPTQIYVGFIFFSPPFFSTPSSFILHYLHYLPEKSSAVCSEVLWKKHLPFFLCSGAYKYHLIMISPNHLLERSHDFLGTLSTLVMYLHTCYLLFFGQLKNKLVYPSKRWHAKLLNRPSSWVYGCQRSPEAHTRMCEVSASGPRRISPSQPTCSV